MAKAEDERGVLDEIHEEVEALRQTRQDYADTTDELRQVVDRLKEDRAQL